MNIDEEFRELICPLTAEEYEGLEKSLLAEGCREPIVVWRDIIVDGHNRYALCTKHDIPYDVIRIDFGRREDAMVWMIDNQLSRRNISTVDRVLLAQKRASLLEGRARANQQAGGKFKGMLKHESAAGAFDNVDKSLLTSTITPINIRKETARISGTSEGTVAKIVKIQKEHPELLNQVRSGEMSINRAYKSVMPHINYTTGESEWYTQPQYIEMARRVMGKIDTDPASNDTAQSWIKANTYYTAEANGLEQDWYGSVWLNPPYTSSLLPKFSEKLLKELDEGHTTQAIVLVNNATETRWFGSLVRRAAAVCFPYKRIGFLKSADDSPRAPLQGQAFIYFGQQIEAFATVFSEIGEIVVPYRLK